MRYRSKKQRKTISTSISLEGFNTNNLKMSSNNLESKFKFVCDHQNDNCNCSSVKRELTTALTRNQEERGRSRSESRIADVFVNKHNIKSSLDNLSQNVRGNDDNMNKLLTLGRSKDKLSEIKMYNTKTLPKRIANLKKQRAKTMKETSKFYMDLPIDDTVLRITESTENLAIVADKSTERTHEDQAANIESIQTEVRNDAKLSKHDVEIISDLLREHKEFDRILKKPPKKKSFDNGKFCSSPDVLKDDPLECNSKPKDTTDATPKPDVPETVAKPELSLPEPLYESLLRNVHVPYKFSPILNRSISHQHYKFKVIKKEPKRPESDYVTLLYSDTGELKSVDGHVIKSLRDEVSLMRNSDSNINYNKMAAIKFDEGISSGSSGTLTQKSDSFSSTTSSTYVPKNMRSTEKPSNLDEQSVANRIRKSIDNANFKNGRMSERRVSDVTDMCRQSIIHRQGGEALGSRMANLDYADPRTLFTTSQSNILINRNSVKTQRDSVFSLTSSSDSVNDTQKNQIHQISVKNNSTSDSFYEQSVEDSLEINDVFRDSAIYSDDNNKTENIYETPTSPIGLPKKSPPPKVPKKPIRTPPPLPNKPPNLSVFVDPNFHARPNIFSPTTEKTPNSWVTKQIHNFEH